MFLSCLTKDLATKPVAKVTLAKFPRIVDRLVSQPLCVGTGQEMYEIMAKQRKIKRLYR